MPRRFALAPSPSPNAGRGELEGSRRRTEVAANAPKGASIGGTVFSPDGTKLLFISKVPNPKEGVALPYDAGPVSSPVSTAPTPRGPGG